MTAIVRVRDRVSFLSRRRVCGPMPLPAKCVAQAVVKLEEAAEFDLLETEDVEVLEALKLAQ